MQIKRLLLIFFILQLPVAGAVAEESLYSGEVVVPGQGAEDRIQALPDALMQVLQKLSGQRDVPFSPQLDEALGNAENLLLSFRYRNVERIGPDGAVTRELRLVAQFMPAAVDRIVQQSGLPRWRQERPAVQFWVVIDDGSKRELKPLEYTYAWESIEDIAGLRGLPVTWPELDEEEAQLIDMRLVWGGFIDYLVERGAPSDGVAIIAARREGPLWNLRWNVANGEQNWTWRNSDQDLMFALAQGVHQMTDQIAAANTIAASDLGLHSIDLTIGGLNSAVDYANCLGYLQDLSLVTAVDILGANPGQVHFRLQLNASTEYLAEAFNRGTVLSPAKAGSDYDYEYLGQ